ncbi:MAG: rhodanese-related sulfurtransferase [Chitinophagales bacterium]|nr:rhodanese-related sulfurtransferase [Chitinophagales bacterium]
MEKYLTLLYYKYVRIDDAEMFAAQHLKFCRAIGLKGRILISEEGINGSVSGTETQCQTYMDTMHADARFSDLWFKIEEVSEPSFGKMHCRYRPNVLAFGEPGDRIDPNKTTGKYLEPEEFLAMKDQPDVVVLDTRNVIEWEVGKFNNAVTLNIEHFRDLPDHIQEIEQYKDKKILAYCTGGIRCEKATAFLLEQGFKDVYQLHGGILNYAQKVGGKDFDGKMYVFDNRIVTTVNTVNPKAISHCHICHTLTEHIINCANPECNLHAPICDKCCEEYEGACSTACKEHPRKREYNGKGYYVRTGAQL